MNNKIIEIVSADAKSVLDTNKSFCAAPWLHTHIWPDGRVFACCMSEYDSVLGNINESDSFIKIWNNDNYKKLRQDMLDGISRPDVCNRCYLQEQHNISSLREKLTKEYWKDLTEQLENTKEDYSADLKIPYWDYRFNNICNLSCRTCGPDLSSSWYQDHIAMYGKVPRYATTKFVVFDPNKEHSVHNELIESQIEHVKEIYFAGGEPILMPEHLDVMQRLIDRNKFDILIRYSTNLSLLSYKGVNFLELWPKFKRVMLYVSLDEIGDRAEYWRNGTNWNRLEKNIRSVIDLEKNSSNVKVGYAPTISIFNVHRIDECVKYLISNNLINVYSSFVYNILQGPFEFNIKNAPPLLKEMANDSLERLKNITNGWPRHDGDIRNLQNWLNEPVSDEAIYFQTSRHLAEIDKIRNQSLKSVAPELYDIYKKYGYDESYNNFTPCKSISE
jgi:radical SAM protein with 4Fe4S-binding SPASM domain